ncbi:MAG: fumarylacetoacetate hydrolase family protein [Candidatus Kariarchaeaceae archaeon]
MRLATIVLDNNELASLITKDGIVPISNLDAPIKGVSKFNEDTLELIKSPLFPKLQSWWKSIDEYSGEVIPFDQIKYAPLYRNPPKIWGIGLNYQDHASDLDAISPTTFPVGFMKPSTTIIGHGDTIRIPELSQKTTGEAELGLIIGKRCRNVPRKDWLDTIAGFTTVLDMTAEDILRQNTRYLGLSKSFDTFFSFGPQLVTPEEIDNVSTMSVSTVLNDETIGQNTVSNMTFPPDYLIEFHSKIMTLFPGDIISTGTPRAAPLSDGDILECQIDGFETLRNTVIDMKK